jgi:ribosomal protein L1
MQRSKTYRAATETFDADELYTPLAAIKIAKAGSKKKFDETVDVAGASVSTPARRTRWSAARSTFRTAPAP